MTANQKIIEQELLRIQKKYGMITPLLIVEESRSESAVLHHHFQWNDSQAAEEYRQWQARRIIAVVSIQHPQMDAPVRVFHNVTLVREDEKGLPQSFHVYLKTVDILKNPQMREQLLERAHREASEWQLRYKSLVELSEIMETMSRLLPKVKEKLKSSLGKK